MNSKGFNRAMVACLWIVLAFMYIPIIAIIGMSFNATPYGMFPYFFTFDWYKILFTESNLLPACVFSLKFAFGVTVAAIIIGTMASFGLQAYSPKWSNRLNALIQLPIIIPWLVTAISLLLLFSFIGAGLCGAAGQWPFCVHGPHTGICRTAAGRRTCPRVL